MGSEGDQEVQWLFGADVFEEKNILFRSSGIFYMLAFLRHTESKLASSKDIYQHGTSDRKSMFHPRDSIS